MLRSGGSFYLSLGQHCEMGLTSRARHLFEHVLKSCITINKQDQMISDDSIA